MLFGGMLSAAINNNVTQVFSCFRMAGGEEGPGNVWYRGTVAVTHRNDTVDVRFVFAFYAHGCSWPWHYLLLCAVIFWGCFFFGLKSYIRPKTREQWAHGFASCGHLRHVLEYFSACVIYAGDDLHVKNSVPERLFCIHTCLHLPSLDVPPTFVMSKWFFVPRDCLFSHSLAPSFPRRSPDSSRRVEVVFSFQETVLYSHLLAPSLPGRTFPRQQPSCRSGFFLLHLFARKDLCRTVTRPGVFFVCLAHHCEQAVVASGGRSPNLRVIERRWETVVLW